MSGQVVAVARDKQHRFSKSVEAELRVIAGLGIEGDAHQGATVKHRSRAAKYPDEPNLRQLHLIHAELFDELADKGFEVGPGELGENVTTKGVDLLGLPTGARLHLGDEVVLQVTGLRNPCVQIDRFQRGLMAATLGRDVDGTVIRKTGVMSVVLAGGVVRPGDGINVELPPLPHNRLGIV